jgi:hypothetical protein
MMMDGPWVDRGWIMDGSWMVAERVSKRQGWGEWQRWQRWVERLARTCYARANHKRRTTTQTKRRRRDLDLDDLDLDLDRELGRCGIFHSAAALAAHHHDRHARQSAGQVYRLLR